MAPHCLRPHRSVSERVAFWLKPCMDNGLGNTIQIVWDSSPRNRQSEGRRSLIQGWADMPWHCQQAAAGLRSIWNSPARSHLCLTPLWSNGLAWSGAVDCQGRWYIGWVQAGHETCMGSDVGDGSTQTCFGLSWSRCSNLLSGEGNAGFTAVHLGWH